MTRRAGVAGTLRSSACPFRGPVSSPLRYAPPRPCSWRINAVSAALIPGLSHAAKASSMQGVGEHISDGRLDRLDAGRAVHESDFALLLMPYGVRHDPQP